MLYWVLRSWGTFDENNKYQWGKPTHIKHKYIVILLLLFIYSL